MVTRHLNRRALTETSRVSEVRRTIVQIDGASSHAVGYSGCSMIYHLEGVGSDHNREQRGGFILGGGAAENGVQAGDVGEIAELKVGGAGVGEFCNEFVELLFIPDRENLDIVRGVCCTDQSQDRCEPQTQLSYRSHLISPYVRCLRKRSGAIWIDNGILGKDYGVKMA